MRAARPAVSLPAHPAVSTLPGRAALSGQGAPLPCRPAVPCRGRAG